MDPRQIIDLRCTEMRFPASDAERQKLAARYAARRAAVDALYELPEVRYAEPAVFFRADAH